MRYFILSVLFLVNISIAYSQENHDLLTRIEESYKDITDIVADFEQKSVLKDLKQTVTFKGKLYVKMPSRFRWVYSDHDFQEVIINNDIIIVYNKKEKQAIKSHFSRERFGSVPIALLGGLGDIRRDFYVSESKGKIILKPSVPIPGILSIELTTSDEDFPVRRLKITDTNMNTIEISLKNVKVNTGLKDSLFEFQPPERVKIIEGLY